MIEENSRHTLHVPAENTFSSFADSVSTPLKIATIATVVLAGLIRVWVGRHSMDPDGMCYLDLGDAFFHRNWPAAINGYWSPLYSWLLGAALFFTHPSRWTEFILVHWVNLAVYLTAIASFEFFRRSLSRSVRHAGDATDPRVQLLPIQALYVVSYAIFLWTSLDLITVWGVSPDLCIAAFVYLIGGILLRMQRRDSFALYAIFGIALGLAYLTKAVMFPLSFAFILIGFCCVPGKRRLAFLVTATLAFLVVSAPWISVLSHAKGRWTFGDSGKLNYSALVSPGGRLQNWQGEPPGSGTPVHTTRKIHSDPPVYEFARPVGGTYPPSYDPSYWNEGRKTTFVVRTQVKVMIEHLLLYVGVFVRDQPGLLVAVLTLLLIGGVSTAKSISRHWPLFAICLAAMGLYMLVHVETRFIGAYVTIIWMAILSGIRLPGSDVHRKVSSYLLFATAVTLLLSVADGTVRAIKAGGPYSALDQIVVSDGLERIGLHSGDQVAVIGDGNWSYWARSGRLRIVTTVMSADAPVFWAGKHEQREEVYHAFAHAGAKAVVTQEPPRDAIGDGWQRVGNTKYYLRWL